MDIHRTLEILETLACGYSPITGELLDSESVINERDVIRALQIAINELKRTNPTPNPPVRIAENEIEHAIHLFESHGISATYNRLTNFFLATGRIKETSVLSDSLYGKYKKDYLKGQLLDFFIQYLPKPASSKKREDPWNSIDFFQEEIFNTLSDKDIRELKEKIHALGIQKTDDLSENVINARVNYPRAYEPWLEEEKELLKKAIQKTNNLSLLSECFQRGANGIESQGKRLIYESKN
jgi:hypothetical protein